MYPVQCGQCKGVSPRSHAHASVSMCMCVCVCTRLGSMLPLEVLGSLPELLWAARGRAGLLLASHRREAGDAQRHLWEGCGQSAGPLSHLLPPDSEIL